jgi:dinuclear metal center YbgI/SA1388 family protein
MSSDGLTVQQLVEALEWRFPSSWAEPWDNVGLIAGDRSASVTGILVTLDATAEAVQRALAVGANVVVTHHPPFLDQPHVARGPGPAGTLEASIRLGVAVISLHTNLDRSPEGSTALPEALGFSVVGPLESAAEPIALIVTYVPPESADAVRQAMASAGAGRIGMYEECSFTSEGVGRFAALRGAEPVARASVEGTSEVRIEMVAPRTHTDAVLAAARDAHPYEEPVVLALEGLRARGVARLGKLCTWKPDATLGELATHVSAVLGVACRVWGDPARNVARIAVANGSAGSLLPDALHRADALVAGEVRYHDALAAMSWGLVIIEAGHDATEWPMVRVLEEAVRAWSPECPVTAESPSLGWWTTKGRDDV